MKKWIKVLLGFFGFVIVLTIIDIINIYTNFKPIFAIKSDYSVYRGLFYDTYVCPEYTVPVIKIKGSKYACSTKLIIINIVDKTHTMKNFSCNQALELIYEDDEFYYYFPCIKSQYVIVEYSNGQTKNIKEVLANGEILVKDLRNYGIEFIKKSK